MSFYLSDGAKKIPRDFDTLICAGMGGDTMVSILEAAPWLKSNRYRLILQCQSKRHLLREYLSDQGWRITEESVLRDGRFLYTVMEVIWQPDAPRLTPGECHFPPAMLENPSAEVPAHFQWILEELSKIVTHRGADAVPETAAALEELRQLAKNPDLSFLTEEIHDHSC
jgi:tRNA A22 N-methylase